MKKPPLDALAQCEICGDVMPLLLQLHADLPAHFPSHERRLHIFGCRKRSCHRKKGCVRAVRSTRAWKARGIGTETASLNNATGDGSRPQEPPQNLGNGLFNSRPSASSSRNSNPFKLPIGTVNNPGQVSGDVSSFSVSSPALFNSTLASADEPPATSVLPMRLTEKPQIACHQSPSRTSDDTWPRNGELPKPYPLLHLEADYETLDDQVLESVMVQTLDLDEAANVPNSKEDSETFESTIDKTFQRFADRLAQNPLQVLRYDFCGVPLLCSNLDPVARMLGSQAIPNIGDERRPRETRKLDGIGMPRCANCGANRVFEVQLMPHAITELEADCTDWNGMDWGTVIVGVCGQDCLGTSIETGEVGYQEEWVGTQWEELC